MANFRTHVTTSTLLGIGYGVAGHYALAMPWDSSLVAGGLCGVAGMFPDLDSDAGIPLRETMALAAAVVPMMLIDRFQHMGLSFEAMTLAGASIYILVRFGLAAVIRKFTVHRGMFHSIPAMLIFAGLGFLICGSENIPLRYYKAGGVMAGFLSHLLLDELYSIEWARGRLRLKKSFGTAVKFWGGNTAANLVTYAMLAIVAAAILGEPMMMERLGVPLQETIYQSAQEALDYVRR